jgi:hypothetical protein
VRTGRSARRIIGSAGVVAVAAAAVASSSQGPPPLPDPGGLLPPVPPLTDDGPLRFQDLSNASGGPVDFGSPHSDVEKAACVFFDADGDGWDDLVSLAGIGEGYRYFLNRPDGKGGRTFVKAPPGNGLDDGHALERDGASVTAGDVDGDGHEDLFIGCGWNDTLPAGSGRNMLLLNDGTGRFTDVAEALGIADGDNTTAACVLFDMDNDGDLDLVTFNSNAASQGKAGDGRVHLFRNTLKETGTLGFVEETAERGLVVNGIAVWAAIATDYDGDGAMDLIVGHDFGGLTQIFHNDGTGHFTDVTATAGSGAGDDGTPSTFGDDSHSAMGIASGDLENHGNLDLYISNAPRSVLYVNQGDGTFTELAQSRGADSLTIGWGVNMADFDLDGWLDVYCAAGDFWGMDRDVVRPFLLRNTGGGSFTDVWAASGMRHDVPLARESGTATADFDRDGRPDLLVSRAERAGASPYLYRNVSDVGGRHWLEVRLAGGGVTTNTSAIGAKIRVRPRDAAGNPIAGLSQLREVLGASGRGSRSSLVQHFGLGADTVTADVEVEWPRAGTLASRRVAFTDVPIDQLVVVAEDRTVTWRLDPTASVDVADARTSVVPCVGAGAPDPLTTLAVSTGPAWLAAGPWQGGRTLRAAPPRVTEPQTVAATIVATAQGAASDATSNQDVTVRVVPTPSVTKVGRPSGRTLKLVGDHFDIAGVAVTIDGQPCVVKSARLHRLRHGATEQRVIIRFPASMRRALKKGTHELRAVEPVAGLATTFTF